MSTSIFPQGIDTFPGYTNSFKYGTITLLENVDETQTSLKVELNVPPTSIITNAWWTLNSEILWLNSVTTNGNDVYFNVLRGQIGTTANSHLAGSILRMPYLAEHYIKIKDSIISIEQFLLNGLVSDYNITSNNQSISYTGKRGYVYSLSIMIKKNDNSDYLTREYVIHHSNVFDPLYFEGYIFGNLNASISFENLTKNSDTFTIKIQNANNCQAKISMRYLGGIF